MVVSIFLARTDIRNASGTFVDAGLPEIPQNRLPSPIPFRDSVRFLGFADFRRLEERSSDTGRSSKTNRFLVVLVASSENLPISELRLSSLLEVGLSTKTERDPQMGLQTETDFAELPSSLAFTESPERAGMAVREGRQTQGIAETQELELECPGPRDGEWIREVVIWHVLESAGEWREGAIAGVKGPGPRPVTY
jgi:hypothetical protein